MIRIIGRLQGGWLALALFAICAAAGPSVSGAPVSGPPMSGPPMSGSAALHSVGSDSVDSDDKLEHEYRLKRDQVLLLAAERHYEIGRWCWKMKLYQQSTAEVLVALELSDQRHIKSKQALAKMQALDDDAWKEQPKRPNPTVLRQLEDRRKQARKKDLREHQDLAKWATRKGLDDQAAAAYERLLRAAGEALEVDEDGTLRIGRAVVPEAIASRLLAKTIVINEQPYLRDEFLEGMGDVGKIHEAGDQVLRVRGTVAPELVQELAALGAALFPILERDFGGRPARRMELFVFATRASFDDYLQGAGLGRFRGGSGVADRGTYTAIVCAEGRPGEDLRALVLHELTHLFHYGVTRAVMPDWYAEGLAEQYGAQGSFEWDGKSLVVGGRMAAHRLESLKPSARPAPLSALLSADAAALFSRDREQALQFYAQSWALVRWLRTMAPDHLRERFAFWEHTCSGAAVGAEVGVLRASNTSPASELFTQLLGSKQAEIERGYSAYLESL